MGPDFVGTPIITLVTPERSTTINSFKLAFDHHPSPRVSLKEQSLREPMFREGFSLEPKFDVDQKPSGLPAGIVEVRLRGTGLLPYDEITVNGVLIQQSASSRKECEAHFLANPTSTCAFQETTHSSLLYFPDPGKDTWTVRYRQRTRQGFETAEIKQRINPEFELKLRHYRRGRPAEADLKLVLPKQATIKEVTLDDPQVTSISGVRGCQEHKTNHDGSILVKCLVPQAAGAPERDRITIRTKFKDQMGNTIVRFEDVVLPVRPRNITIRNPRTNKAAGFASEDETVVIEGANLQGVTAVLFGDKEAKLLSSGDPEVLVVRVPRAEVSQGQASLVPVVLKTGAELIPVGSYTYAGAPLPKVVVAPYPWPAKE
jgi:hypothetical protein